MLSVLTNTTLQEIKEYVSAAKERSPHLASRIDRALYLILMRDFKVTSETTTEIESETEEGRYYHLTNGKTCNCADFTRKNAPNGWCKHRLAFFIVTKLESMTQDRLASTEQRLRDLEARLAAMVILQQPTQGLKLSARRA